jgi:hypothetical protein
MNQVATARRDTARMDPRSGACREGHLSLFLRVDVNDDRDGTAVADEDDRLSPGDEGDEGLGAASRKPDAAAVLTGPLLPAPKRA